MMEHPFMACLEGASRKHPFMACRLSFKGGTRECNDEKKKFNV
jgi:hypothetical protein